MSEGLWQRRPLPASGSAGTGLGNWAPTRPADVTAHRLELAAALHGGARPPGAEEGAVERLLLAYEELVSNALRHGRPPVRVTLTTADHYWLLDVSDAAVDLPPTPAVGRDAAEGGLGLYLVAQIAGAHGWSVEPDGSKHVWARIDFTRAEAATGIPRSLPRPREGNLHDSTGQ